MYLFPMASLKSAWGKRQLETQARRKLLDSGVHNPAWGPYALPFSGLELTEAHPR